MRIQPSRGYLLLILPFVLLSGTSCVVPPSCFDRTFGSSTRNHGHFASVHVYAEPIEEPKRRYSTGMGMWERFERNSTIMIDGEGTMAVSTLNMWPRSCPRIPQEHLAEVSGYWQPVLERFVTLEPMLQVMANPYTFRDDWRPDGPLISLTFGPASGKNFRLMWDGQSSLPEDVDRAVIATLGMMCANSRLAKTYLIRDLPEQVSSRLERCLAPTPPHSASPVQARALRLRCSVEPLRSGVLLTAARAPR